MNMCKSLPRPAGSGCSVELVSSAPILNNHHHGHGHDVALDGAADADDENDDNDDNYDNYENDDNDNENDDDESGVVEEMRHHQAAGKRLAPNPLPPTPCHSSFRMISMVMMIIMIIVMIMMIIVVIMMIPTHSLRPLAIPHFG